MCGIVGFITKEDKVGETGRASFFKQALIIDTLRGDDSTGMYLVKHVPDTDDGTPYWLKQVGTGAEFVNSQGYWDQAYDVAAYRAAVGHNRAATSGKVDSDSAHPFQEGPITLVHNGTLTSTHGLPNPMAGLKGVSVDSHAICHNLAKHSVKDVVAALHGAFALVWHDARDDSMNVVRNSKRPLHFGLGQKGSTLFFMSEGGMLHMLSDRLDLGVETIYFPDEGQHLKWLPDTPLDRPLTESLELYTDYWPARHSSAVSAYGAYSYYGGSSWDDDDLGPWTSDVKPRARDAREDYIRVGGRRQPVPMVIQEALLQHNIVVEDRLRFTPQSAGMNPQDSELNYVIGVLEGKRQAILYGCLGATVSGSTDRDWTVRVIGVKISTNGEPWFICRLVSTFVVPSELTSNKLPTPIRVPGPEGEMLSHGEFKQVVVEGCVMCTAPIGVMDAHDLVWTSEGAICPNCDDRLYEPRSYYS